MSPYGGGVVGIIIPPYPVPEMAGITDAGEAIKSTSHQVTNYHSLHSIQLILLHLHSICLTYLII